MTVNPRPFASAMKSGAHTTAPNISPELEAHDAAVGGLSGQAEGRRESDFDKQGSLVGSTRFKLRILLRRGTWSSSACEGGSQSALAWS